MALGSSADRSSLPMLITILERGEPELRAAAAHAVGMIGPTAAEAPVLVKALNDPVPTVRDAVLQALDRMSDPGARLLVLRGRATQGKRLRVAEGRPCADRRARRGASRDAHLLGRDVPRLRQRSCTRN